MAAGNVTLVHEQPKMELFTGDGSRRVEASLDDIDTEMRRRGVTADEDKTALLKGTVDRDSDAGASLSTSKI